MRVRTTLTAAFLACTVTVAAGRPDDPPGAVKLKGSVDDEKLIEKAPPQGVVVSAKGWETLAKAWGIKDVPKVDFGKTLLVVATTRGSQLKLTPRVEGGDLKVVAISTRDLRPGFRYAIESVAREGVKTVNGQPLPKE
jgi:hypothetical protein